jgi:hypothetical protein
MPKQRKHFAPEEKLSILRRHLQLFENGAARFIGWLGVASSKFYQWCECCGRVHEPNGWVPGTSGWKTGRSKRSSTSTSRTRWKGIDASRS